MRNIQYFFFFSHKIPADPNIRSDGMKPKKWWILLGHFGYTFPLFDVEWKKERMDGWKGSTDARSYTSRAVDTVRADSGPKRRRRRLFEGQITSSLYINIATLVICREKGLLFLCLRNQVLRLYMLPLRLIAPSSSSSWPNYIEPLSLFLLVLSGWEQKESPRRGELIGEYYVTLETFFFTRLFCIYLVSHIVHTKKNRMMYFFKVISD